MRCGLSAREESTCSILLSLDGVSVGKRASRAKSLVHQIYANCIVPKFTEFAHAHFNRSHSREDPQLVLTDKKLRSGEALDSLVYSALKPLVGKEESRSLRDSAAASPGYRDRSVRAVPGVRPIKARARSQAMASVIASTASPE